ncbi:flagellar basal body P-ring formation chaperone FlgA [Desulfobaculum sp. SPO524]|uniref:flagellar basal body P-ring formation chaperone FlgA n=1 Tax=Desulfobaculum sp. SPO524 TaxID=3378071 RepID=UPI003853BC8C
MNMTRDTAAGRRLSDFAPALATLVGALVVLCWLFVAVAQAGETRPTWRIAVRDAAVVQGDVVRLGEIASPVGNLKPDEWKVLAATELWKAPRERGDQTSIPREKLQRIMDYYLEDYGELCILPGRLVVQKGGRLVRRDGLIKGIVETLTPKLKAMPGENSLRDYRLPDYVFLSDSQNTLKYEITGDLEPGRLSLQILEMTMDGRLCRRMTGTAFVDSWRSVACAAKPLNRRETVTPDKVTFMRKNVAYLRNAPWDGKTMGVRVMRSVGEGQVIYAEILDDVPLVSRGDKVTLLFEGRNIQLAVTAKALEDGRFGETIVVRNLQSNREVSGVVRDGGSVVVR